MSIFGKLFDFDHDGEVSSGEAMMGLGGAALIAGMAEEQEKRAGVARQARNSC